MTATVLIPGVLRADAGGSTELSVAASSVREALAEIERTHPALYRRLCDETGKVRPHLGLFVNATHVREREGIDTPLASGDVVIILPAVSGG
jgi:molybdopterin converting factor small subunit